MLLATIVLAALTGYTGSVTREGLQRTLAHPTFESAGGRFTSQVPGGGFPAADRSLRAALHEVFGDVPVTVSAGAQGDSYALAGQEKRSHPELTVFAMYSGIEDHATLTSGSWPRPAPPGPGTVEAVLPVPAAKAMKVAAGDTFVLHSRLGRGTAAVRVTGLFQVDRADDPFWSGDPLVTQGAERGGYTTYGPLVVPPGTFAGRFDAGGVSTRWQVLPDTRVIGPDQLAPLAGRMDALSERLREHGQFTVVTAFPELMRRLDGALTVARSTMLIPVLQLIVLAGYALLLVGRLMADHRRMEVALLRARGAAVPQLAALALGEGLLLAAPAAVAAPLLCPPLLRLLAAAPTLRASGLRLDSAPSTAIWLTALGAALACSLALTLPSLRGVAVSYVESQTARGRGERRGGLQRAGADAALLAVAGLGLWQLSHYGRPVTAGGVDPFLVAGPMLALLAGGTLVLRLVPVVSRGAEWLTSRGRGLAPALGARQVSRRPLRYAGPALLLVMAVAVGVLSVSTAATWRTSQLAQADFQAGADLRLSVRDDPSNPTPLGQGGRYAALPAVTALSPVLRTTATAGNHEITLLAGDARAMSRVLRAGAVPHVAALAAARESGTTVALPGAPETIAFDLRLTGRRTGDRAGITGSRVAVTLVDGRGVAREADLGPIRPDGAVHTAVLTAAALAGPGGRISYPLAVRSLRYDLIESPRSGPLTLSLLRVRGGTATGYGPPAGSPPGARWRVFADAAQDQAGNPAPQPRAGRSPGALLTMIIPPPPAQPHGLNLPNAGTLHAVLATSDTAGATAQPEGGAPPGQSSGEPPGPMPGIITADLAAQAKVGVGGQVTLSILGAQQPVTVVGVVGGLPSAAPGRPAVLVDLNTVTERSLAAGIAAVPPNEWWLGARTGGARAAAVLTAHPDWQAGVVDRTALRRQLRDAPLGAALQGALVLGFAAALAFAVIGFAVNLSVSVRERRGEFAVLRALGSRPGQLFGLLGMEQAVLAGLGLAGGTALGVAAVLLVVPHIVLTVQAAAPFPAVEVIVPWPLVLGILGGIAALLCAALALVVRAQRRGGLGTVSSLEADR